MLRVKIYVLIAACASADVGFRETFLLTSVNPFQYCTCALQQTFTPHLPSTYAWPPLQPAHQLRRWLTPIQHINLPSQESPSHNAKKIKRKKSSSFLAFTSQKGVSLGLGLCPLDVFRGPLGLFHCFHTVCSYLLFLKGVQCLFIVCTFQFFSQLVCFYSKSFPFWSLFLKSPPILLISPMTPPTPYFCRLQDYAYTKKKMDRVQVWILRKLWLLPWCFLAIFHSSIPFVQPPSGLATWENTV